MNVTRSGTKPPPVTVTGTPSRWVSINDLSELKSQRGGRSRDRTIQVPIIDNGMSFVGTDQLTALTVLLRDSKGNDTGITVHFPPLPDTYTIDNVYVVPSTRL